ncbi:flagellar hook-length control protein FliK [Geminicoccus flavidas]|uniref:flagellar hook-length control protein FliK n=1 Tax=Geminicoccus flavidas TaxID=2506407 RepID=UPI00135AAE2C|nr:flagellar hook-length control protein FliK [Geminicoccus flavidas]
MPDPAALFPPGPALPAASGSLPAQATQPTPFGEFVAAVQAGDAVTAGPDVMPAAAMSTPLSVVQADPVAAGGLLPLEGVVQGTAESSPLGGLPAPLTGESVAPASPPWTDAAADLPLADEAAPPVDAVPSAALTLLIPAVLPQAAPGLLAGIQAAPPAADPSGGGSAPPPPAELAQSGKAALPAAAPPGDVLSEASGAAALPGTPAKAGQAMASAEATLHPLGTSPVTSAGSLARTDRGSTASASEITPSGASGIPADQPGSDPCATAAAPGTATGLSPAAPPAGQSNAGADPGPARPAAAATQVPSTGSAPDDSQGGEMPADMAPAPGPALPSEPAVAAMNGPYGRGSDAYVRATPQADPAAQLAPTIAQSLSGDRRVVSVQLHPAELGVVQIRVVVEQDRRVRAVLSATRPETVELLQRHAPGIERALTATGLSLAGSDALTFDLGTSWQQGGQEPDRGPGGHTPASGSPEPLALLPDEPAPAALRPATGLFDLVL